MANKSLSSVTEREQSQMFSGNVKRDQLNQSEFCTLEEVVQFNQMLWQVHTAQWQEILLLCSFSALPWPGQVASAFCPAHLLLYRSVWEHAPALKVLLLKVVQLRQILEAEGEKGSGEAKELVPRYAGEQSSQA